MMAVSLIDGVDVRAIGLADLRHYVTVVPQNPYCFDGTVADNLRLFDPTVSEDKMIAAAKMACAHRFIERLPGNYNFELLPGGANLWQKAAPRVSAARSFTTRTASLCWMRRRAASTRRPKP